MIRLFGSLCLILAAAFGTGSPVPAQGLDQQRLDTPRIHRDVPLEVEVGIEIEQITAVDQKSENYGAVAVIRMLWRDPALAFDEATEGEDFKLFRPTEFLRYTQERETIAPIFNIRNQQSNRWIHQALVTVFPDGTALYADKSSLTLQAPHFEFTRYPFDRQVFFFSVVSAFPDHVVRYIELENQTGLGERLGEEEWILDNARMEIGTTKGLSGGSSARAALVFEGHRHIQYYVTKMFVPMLVLITVSWAVFFLNEYRKRAEVAGANLLVFVGFNWMISDDLPRLGYLTFLDFILQWMFVVTGAIVVFNIALAHMQQSGRAEQAGRLDNYAIRWIYPLGYLAIVGYGIARYLVPIQTPTF